MKRQALFIILFLLLVAGRVAAQSPTITITQSVQKVCLTGFMQTSSLVYSATTESPIEYSIDWTDMTDQGSTSFAFSATGGTINDIMIPADATAGTHTGTLTVSNASGSGTASISVTVNPLPTPSITITENSGTANDGTVCAGSDVTLAGGGGSSYIWDNGITNAVSFTASVTTNYTVTITDANGCTATKSQTITVNSLPTPTISITETSGTANDGVVCAGSDVTLAGGGGTSYSWDNSITDGVSFIPLSTTTYTVSVTGSNGCVATLPQTITVNSLPTPAITITESSGTANDGTVCAGSGVTLAGGGGTSYSWDNGITDGVSFIPLSTITYTVTVTDENGCTATLPQPITVNSLPIPTITITETSGTENDGAVCTGSSVMLAGGGGTSYFWDHGITDGVSFVPSSTTTYTVTVTDANGCNATLPQTITVNSLPIPSITITENSGTANDGTVCAGSSVILTGGGGMSYSWDNGITNGGSFIASVTRTYTVTVTDANGCNATLPQIITVNPLQTLSTATLRDIACTGTPAVIHLTGLLPNSVSTIAYKINGSSKTPVTGVTADISGIADFSTVNVTTANEGQNLEITSITVTSSTPSCPETFSVTVVLHVDQLPTLTSVSQTATVCDGTGAIIEVGGLIHNTTSTINYTINGVAHTVTGVPSDDSGIATFTSFPLTAANNGKRIYATGITNTGWPSGCSSTISNKWDALSVNPIPEPVISGSANVCAGSTGNLYHTASGKDDYVWSITGGTITGGAGTYEVTVTWGSSGTGNLQVSYGVNGCTGTSLLFPVSINPNPSPSITGSNSACLNSTGNLYSTQSGMMSYSWSVSPGGTITSATNESFITVNWTAPGSKTVNVTYSTTGGCTTAPGTLNVQVKPSISDLSVTFGSDPKIGATMHASYHYTDGTTGNGAGCTFRWFRNGAVIPSATGIDYIAQTADLNKVLTVEVTPVSTVCADYSGIPVLSDPTPPIEDLDSPGATPYADLVCIEGIRDSLKILTGKYRYNCIKPEGVSTYRWIRRDSVEPHNEVVIGTDETYTLRAADLEPDKEIYFEVTPVTSNYNPITGVAKRSKPLAKIFGLKDQYSIAEGDAVLTSNVSGGSFTGNGIITTPTEVYFSPSKAGEGDHMITYLMFYDNTSFTCSQRAPELVNVDPDIPQFSSVNAVYCHNAIPFTVDVSNIKINSINNDFNLEGPKGPYPDDITVQDTVGSIDHIVINPYLLTPGLNKLTYTYQIRRISTIIVGGLPRTMIFYLTYSNSVEFTVDYVSEYIKFINLGTRYCKSADDVYISVEGISPYEGTPHWSGSFLSEEKVNSAVFSPSEGTIGSTYNISYYYESPLGCLSQTLNAYVKINAMPDARFLLKPSYNVDGQYQKLVPMQYGGEFTGRGVSGGILFPDIAGVGRDTVTYRITDINRCTNTLSKYTEIRKAEGAITGINDVVCYDNPVHTITAANLPLTGVVKSLGFSDTRHTIANIQDTLVATFDARLTGTGIDTVFFSYKWDSVDYRISRIVDVENLGDVVIYDLEQDQRICDDTSAFELKVSKTGGVFSGPVYIDPVDHKDYFNPKTGTPDDTVKYVYTSAKGCIVDTSIYIHVYKAPVVDFAPVDLCIDNSSDVTMFDNLTVHADPVVRWEWIFTDESKTTSDSRENAGYLYLKGGLQKASLTAVTDKGCKVTEEKTFTLARKPEADFYWKKDCFHPDSPGDSLLLFDATTYTTTPKDYIWIREGDALQKTGQTESYEKPNTGYLRISHVVTTNTAGCYDTVIKDIYIRPTFDIPPDGKFEDFESGNGGWVKSDASPIWFFGKPSGSVLKSAASGTSAWFTASPMNDTASIESPCYDFRNLSRPLIRLKLQKALDKEHDGVALQYRVGDEWKWHTVGTLNDGINWYNSATISGEPGGSQVGWTTPGSYDTQFQTASHTLDELIDSTNVVFRITYGSEGSKVTHEGFIFDDIFIGDRTRHVLVEHFMNTADAKSTEVKSLVDTIAKRKEVDVINIQYHTNFPGNDPYYGGNPGEINARILYYGLTHVPYTFVDGGNDPKLHALVFDHLNTEIDSNAITKRSLVNAPFIISLDPEINGRLLTVKGSIKAVERLDSTNLTLFLVVTERKNTDGATTFLNIFRKFIPDAGGIILKNNWLPGDLQTVNQAWTIDKSLNTSGIEIIAFLQNRITQQVYQASSVVKLNIQVGIDDPLLNGSEYTIYPNPASDRITVDFGSRLTGNAVIRIYGIGGEILREYKAGAGSSEFTIEDSGLRGGVYLLRVIQGKLDLGYRKLIITEN